MRKPTLLGVTRVTPQKARKDTRFEWYFMQNFDVAYRQHRFRSINLLCIMQLRLPPLSIYYMLVKLTYCQTRFKPVQEGGRLRTPDWTFWT